MTTDHYPDFDHEETYKGYTLYVENNADQHIGGYEYCVTNDSGIIEEGLEFDAQVAVQKARDYVNSLS